MAGPKCRKCNNKISRHEDNISCTGPCAATFHLKCANMSMDVFMEKRRNGELSEWACVSCGTNSSKISGAGSFSGEVSSILPDNPQLTDIISLLNNLLTENIKLQKSVAETHSKLDAQTSQLQQLLVRTKVLEDENRKLKVENEELKISHDDLEQYSRRNCIEIHGIPEVQGENIISEVIKIGRAIGEEIKPTTIDNCHRLGKQIKDSPVIRGIIVKFVRNFDKEQFLKCRKVKRNLNTLELGFNVNNIVYVNENLTQRRRSLMARARKMKRVFNLAYVWSKNGRVYVRERENTKIILINSDKDLDSIERNCKDTAERILAETN